MKKFVIIISLISVLAGLASGQKTPAKPWTQWTNKDVKMMLDESGWGLVQTDTDTSQLLFRQSNSTTHTGSSETDIRSPASVSYHIRFLSARPIRQALARQIMLAKELQSPPDQLKTLAEMSSGDFITIAVYCDSSDPRAVGPSMQAFGSANLGVLKNAAYLERKDGKRLFIDAYQPPNSQGYGALFRFQRMADGKPFITADTGTVRFHAEVPYTPGAPPSAATQSSVIPSAGTSNMVLLEMKFKVSEMMFDGKLEY